MSLDLYGEKCFGFDFICCEDPMTAIAKIYTPEGFVVATDGRKLNNQTGKFTDDIQKVFELSHISGKMCFSVAGVGEFLVAPESSLMVSDIISESAGFIAEASVQNSDDYAELLRMQIQLELQDRNLSSLASGSVTETHIFLDGYILGRPMRRKITLDYKSGKLMTSWSDEEGTPPGYAFGRGSETVWGIIFGSAPDSRLASYRQICQPPRPATLSQAIRVCHAAICAHCDPEALTIDRENCQGVGGRIRIATVTPSEGFRMVSETDCHQSI